jgi:hypothetical protein
VIAAISSIPVKLMPAYHADPWVVRGRLKKQELKTTETTNASKPRRISKNTLRLLRDQADHQGNGSRPAPRTDPGGAVAAAHPSGEPKAQFAPESGIAEGLWYQCLRTAGRLEAPGRFGAPPGEKCGPGCDFFSAGANNRVTAHVATAADAT